MRQKALSNWLKFIIVGVGACGLVVYLLVVPMLGQTVAVAEDGVFDHLYWPWLVLIWVTALPIYAALAFGWIIAVNIGKDRSFSVENARLLKWISGLAAGDAAFFFIGNILYLFLDWSHPGVTLMSLIVVFVGVAISVAAAALSHLVMKAALLQEQQELTI
ncbi:MAG: DUF2975 domain-containing protein [Oscillospiraceae bacterium]|nr:DUF2975 domain-containing protein [Oscillospiraceae bacterium]